MEKIDIVIIPYNDFLKGEIYGFRTRDQHLISEIIKDERVGRVVIVERPRSIFTFIQTFKLGIKRGEKLGKNLKRIRDNIFVFEFFSVGLGQARLKHLWFDKVYGSGKYVNLFTEIVKKIGFGDFVALSFNPFANKFIASIDARKVIFDIMDNFYFHPEFSYLKDHMFKSFEWISKNADLIFCVNENVKRFFIENYQVSSNKVCVLPNGVGDDLRFSDFIPNDILKISKPRVGYVGVLSERIDFDLIEYIARQRNEYNFIFVGGRYGDIKKMVRRLRHFKNIYFLGDKCYDEIPSYIASFDVCIIPHKINEFTLSNDPMKIYEYLYAGKPVVSTNISIRDELRDYIFVAKDRAEFLRFLDLAVGISGDSDFIKRQRWTIGRDMFWSEKARFMLDKIFSLLR